MGNYYFVNDKYDELYHYGVRGMKWGVRHDPDRSGSFRGRYYRRHANAVQRDIDSFKGHTNGIYTRSGKQVVSKKDVSDTIKGLEKVRDKSLAKADRADARKANRKPLSRGKKIAIGGAVVVAAGLTAYGAYKVSKIRSKNITAVETWLLKNGRSSLDKFADGTVTNRTVKRSNTLLGPRLDVTFDTYTRNMYAPSSRSVSTIGSKARALRRTSRYI